MPSLVSLRRLLRRFLDVCNTVAYAHSRGVIHRDLKPHNILLGPYGETLLVDWGLAKTTDSSDPQGVAPNISEALSTCSPVQTKYGKIAGTPGYMSPEQAKGNGELTTACDIYGLGATLYCLLTGRAPRSGTDRNEQISAVRSASFLLPTKIVPRLPRALEAVCLKAMRVEPDERYSSASALAQDLEAWLEDEPVSCHRERPLEGLGRWTRKNRSWVGVAGAALAIVAGVAIISTLTVDRARRLEASAHVRATENLQTSLNAIDKMLTNVGNKQLVGIPQLSPVRQALLDDALVLLESINKRQPADQGVKHRLARVRIRVGKLALWMGSHQRAIEVLGDAERDVEQLQEEFPSQRYTGDLMNIRTVQAFVYQERSQWKLAEQFERQALELFDQLPAEVRRDPERQFERAQTLGDLAYSLSHQGNISTAEHYYRESKSLLTQLTGSVNSSAHGNATARMLVNFGSLLCQIGKNAEAQTVYSEALANSERLVGKDQVYPDERLLLARTCDHLSQLVAQRDGPRESEQVSRRALEQRDRLATEYPGVDKFQYELALSFGNLAYYISQREVNWNERQYVEHLDKRKDEVTHLYEQSLDMLSKLATDHADVPMYLESLANTYNNLGIFHSEVGDWTRAIEAYSGTVRTQMGIKEQFGETPERVSLLGGALNNLAIVLAGQGDFTGANEKYLEAISYQKKALSANNKNPTYRSFLRNHYSGLAIAYTLVGSSERALSATRDCVRIARELYQDQGDIADYRSQLNSQYDCLAFLLADAPGDGVDNLEEARDLVAEAVIRSPKWRFYQVHLAEIECRLENLEHAQQALDQAQTLQLDPEDLPYELLVQAALYHKQGEQSKAIEAFNNSTEVSNSLEMENDMYDRYFLLRIERLRAYVGQLLGLTPEAKPTGSNSFFPRHSGVRLSYNSANRVFAQTNFF